MKYIVSGKANSWPVLCASKQNYNYIVDCPGPNVLMTLLQGDDSQDMIRKLEGLSTGHSNAPLKHFSDRALVSNGNLQAINVNKWIDNSAQTDIEKVNQCMWRCE